jgi:hypothetical protein
MNHILRTVAIAATVSCAATAVPAQTLIGGKTAVALPVVISQPGSYRLAANLIVPAGAVMDAVIVVNADDVTIDLDGFTLAGPTSCSGQGATLVCAGGQVATGIKSDRLNTVVRNGTVKGFA